MKKIILSILLLSSLVYANLVDDGANAYKNGNYKEAAKLFRKAANHGYALAQYDLGYMYAKGQGVRQDLHTAKELFGKACDNGYQDGCDSYRILNEQGVQ